MHSPTYVFEDEKVYAIVSGQVIAASDDVDELEEELSKEKSKKDEKPKKATHVVTPNGVKGRILGSVHDVWGEEEVSIRLENGRIAHLKVADAEFVADEEEEKENPVENLRKRVNDDPEGDKDSLKDRKDELEKVKAEASVLIQKGASQADEEALDDIYVTADHELGEIDERLEYLDSEEAQAFSPPAPFEPTVVEQGNMGPSDGKWLDHTLDEMVEEANNYDYDQMMAEGPEAFVAELDEGVLDQPEAVQTIAAGFIRSKTAAADPVIREKYEQVWLARVEEVRQAAEKNEPKSQKEAALEAEWADVPDESLFD